MAGQDDEFEQLVRATNLQLAAARRSSTDWFRGLINRVRGVNTPRTQLFTKNSVPQIGGMYLFSYDPKHKDKLPFWDSYPLVIPIEYYNDGFLGINLHYLPVDQRISLLRNLSKTFSNPNINRTARINVNYRLLKGMSNQLQLSGNYGILKRYLFSHTRSTFHEVDPSEWSNAAALPLQRWTQNTNPKLRQKPPY